MQSPVLVLFVLSVAFCCSVAQETASRPVWYTYQNLLNDREAMMGINKCLSGQQECTTLQNQIKDVFKENFGNECRNCCSFRRNMVTEMMNKFGEFEENIELQDEVTDPKEIEDMYRNSV